MGPERRLTSEPRLDADSELEVESDIMENSRLGMLRTDLGESESKGAGIGSARSWAKDVIPYAI